MIILAKEVVVNGVEVVVVDQDVIPHEGGAVAERFILAICAGERGPDVAHRRGGGRRRRRQRPCRGGADGAVGVTIARGIDLAACNVLAEHGPSEDLIRCFGLICWG